ncbi:methylmalonyl-CoA mutase OS=Streptomyces cyaneofuscatus OX=66883 GN=mutA PE=4 SV=1 [Streptomyces cyaneofuscatus]
MTVQPADGSLRPPRSPTPPHDQWQSLVEGVLRKSGKEVTGSGRRGSAVHHTGGRAHHPAPSTPRTTRRRTPAARLRPLHPGQHSRGERGRRLGRAPTPRPDQPRPAQRGAARRSGERGHLAFWLTVGGPAGVPVKSGSRGRWTVSTSTSHPSRSTPRPTWTPPRHRGCCACTRSAASPRTRRAAPWAPIPLGHEARASIEADLTAAVHWAQRLRRGVPGAAGDGPWTRSRTTRRTTDAEELGLSLATGVAYLRALAGGRRLRAWRRPAAQLEFRYAATADQFLTIAKLRAARRLSARAVAEALGAPRRPAASASTP